MNWIAILTTGGVVAVGLLWAWASGHMGVGRRAARVFLALAISAALGLAWPLTLLLASTIGVLLLCDLAFGSEDAA